MTLLQEGKFRPNTGGVSFMAMASIGMALAGAFAVIENEQHDKADKI
jgi:hypothetical protein